MTTDDPEQPRWIAWADPAPVPGDAIRVEAAGDVRIVLAPADDGRLDIGLLLELPPPIGAVRVTLRADQLSALHRKLDSLIHLDARQVADLVQQIHNPTIED